MKVNDHAPTVTMQVTLTTDPWARIRVEARRGGVTVRVETAATTTFDAILGDATAHQPHVGEHVIAAIKERVLTQGLSRVYEVSTRGLPQVYAVSMYTESRSLTGVVEARLQHTRLVTEHHRAIAAVVNASLVALVGP